MSLLFTHTTMNLDIHTAQNVNIAYKTAGLLPRINSTIIDWALLGGIALLFFSVVTLILDFEIVDIAIYIFLTILSFYHLVCEYFFNGRSLGKTVLHLRVVRLDGMKLTFWDCLIRWALRLVDISATSGLLAMVSVILTSKSQRIGDLAAGTTVIIEAREKRLSRIIEKAPEDYTPQFPQVTILSDKDVSIIKEIVKTAEANREYHLYTPLAAKIKQLIEVRTDMNDRDFILTVLKDYIHLTE